MSKKHHIYIDVKEARSFLWKVYGLKTQIVNEYHMKVVHEEYYGVFHWYYTTGSTVLEHKHGHQSVGMAFDAEELAILIHDIVHKDISEGKFYWKKSTGKFVKPTLETLGTTNLQN